MGGFIEAYGPFLGSGDFADASANIDGALVLSVRTTTPEYEGFRVTVASGTAQADYACSAGGALPGSDGCYKSNFSVPASEDFVDVVVPFSSFSDKWSSATGEQTTTCADDSSVCLTADNLAAIQRVGVWAEGKAGEVYLEIESIRAVGAAEARKLEI